MLWQKFVMPLRLWLMNLCPYPNRLAGKHKKILSLAHTIRLPMSPQWTALACAQAIQQKAPRSPLSVNQPQVIPIAKHLAQMKRYAFIQGPMRLRDVMRLSCKKMLPKNRAILCRQSPYHRGVLSGHADRISRVMIYWCKKVM